MLLQLDIQLPRYHLLKKLFFSHWIVFTPLLKSIGYKYKSFFWILNLFHWSICPSVQLLLHCLDYYSFVGVLKKGSVSSSTLFFFEIIFAILDPLHFHVNSTIGLSISAKRQLGFWWRLQCRSAGGVLRYHLNNNAF